MADLDPHAALCRRDRRGENLAVAHRVVARARVGVRDDIAGTKEIQKRRELARRVADVAHHTRAAYARALAREDRALERLKAVRPDDLDCFAHLDAEHELRVFRERLRRLVDVGIIDVEHLAYGEARKPDRRDVHEGVNAAPRLRDDVMLERGEGVGARVARAHVGRGRRVGHQLVRGQAERRDLRVDVRVHVDEARQHELAPRVESLLRARVGDVGLQRRDHRVLDADVAPRAQLLAGVEDFTTLDDEVEFVGLRERAGRTGKEFASGNGSHGVLRYFFFAWPSAEQGWSLEQRSPITPTDWISISMPGRAKLVTVMIALPG